MATKKKKDGVLTDEDTAPAKKSKKKLLVVAVLVLALGGGGYMFLGKSKGAAAAETPKPGAVVPLEAIHVNLADGHYLKLGLALQATADAKEAPDGSHALDLAIDLFSGRSLTQLGDLNERAKLKKKLVREVDAAYEHEVMDIYFTEFVTQ